MANELKPVQQLSQHNAMQNEQKHDRREELTICSPAMYCAYTIFQYFANLIVQVKQAKATRDKLMNRPAFVRRPLTILPLASLQPYCTRVLMYPCGVHYRYRRTTRPILQLQDRVLCDASL